MTTTQGYKFPKRKRLTDKRLIDRIFKEGVADFGYPFRVVSLQHSKNTAADSPGNKCCGEVKILISVRKKQHKRAVERNLLKRRSREAFRLNINRLNYKCQQDLNIAFVYISDKVADYKTIENGMAKCIEKLAHRYASCGDCHTADAAVDL
ncbi:MAG: ribonuclease P protein component [Rikenellaceae bacterium]|nr:ribonuclease P protein component [Rikenellaceae bacterium]